MVDLAGGNVQIMFDAPPSLYGQIKAGRLRVLASVYAKRSELFPDAPTLAELGFPRLEGVIWYGLSGPAGMPAAIVKRISDELQKLLAAPRRARALRPAGRDTDADDAAAVHRVHQGRNREMGSGREIVGRESRLAWRPRMAIHLIVLMCTLSHSGFGGSRVADVALRARPGREPVHDRRADGALRGRSAVPRGPRRTPRRPRRAARPDADRHRRRRGGLAAAAAFSRV